MQKTKQKHKNYCDIIIRFAKIYNYLLIGLCIAILFLGVTLSSLLMQDVYDLNCSYTEYTCSLVDNNTYSIVDFFINLVIRLTILVVLNSGCILLSVTLYDEYKLKLK